MVLLVVASVSFVFGISGALLFFPGDCDHTCQAQGASPAPAVNWEKSFAGGSDQAKRGHKYILADVYTDWCGWCKRLDRDVFTNSSLSAYLQKDFVCVKVNAEDPQEGSALAQQYQVTGYPCALVFSPDGKLIGRIEGYEEARDYISRLHEIIGAGSK